MYDFFQSSEEIDYKAPNNSELTCHKTDIEFEVEQAFFLEYYKWPPKSTTVEPDFSQTKACCEPCLVSSNIGSLNLKVIKVQPMKEIGKKIDSLKNHYLENILDNSGKLFNSKAELKPLVDVGKVHENVFQPTLPGDKDSLQKCLPQDNRIHLKSRELWDPGIVRSG